MNLLVQAMTEKDSYTENGALTNSTSHNFNLDLFFLAGACRNESVENIENILVKSYAYDRIKTLKIIFWAGDIRGGAGERRFFKLALNWLYNNHKEDLYTYLDKVPEFSRWDVLFQFEDDRIFNYIIEQFKAGNSLLCKWLPRKAKRTETKKSEKTVKHGRTTETTVTKYKTTRVVKDGYALKLRKKLGWNEAQYRKHLVKYTNVVETQMCNKAWSDINYEHVPSVAMNKYNKAWYRNDKERFEAYIESVKSGEKKINAGAIFPHDIIGQVVYSDMSGIPSLNKAQITQWNNLPDYMSDFSILPICDVSASMTWENNAMAMKISLALGLYISERNKGVFKDAFITFSSNPRLQYLQGNINDRIRQLIRQDWNGNTDIEAVFDLILDRAVSGRIPESEMPRSVLIISDMEFDEGTTGTDTTHEVIEKKYRNAGYRCPNIIYWNVNGRVGNVPVTTNDYGAALISGASPSILKAVLTDDVNPEKIMNNAIESERYSFIK